MTDRDRYALGKFLKEEISLGKDQVEAINNNEASIDYSDFIMLGFLASFVHHSYKDRVVFSPSVEEADIQAFIKATTKIELLSFLRGLTGDEMRFISEAITDEDIDIFLSSFPESSLGDLINSLSDSQKRDFYSK